jgi:hypothetical protein
MSGGAAKIVPAYQQQKLEPNIPNEQKQIIQNKYPPKQMQEPNPTLNIQYYQPPPPKKAAPSADQQLNKAFQFLPFIAPDIAAPYNYFNYMYPGQAIPQAQIPPVIVKNYTIPTDGIAGGHKSLSMIYEDVLPQNKYSPSYTTVGERMENYQFIRSAILNNSDGNDIDLHGMSNNSISSFIKVDISDVNPYNTYKHSLNPYNGLPYGFLLMRSCYPIKHIEKTGLVGCSRNSTAVNVRIYKMLEGSFFVHRYNKKIFFEFDEWREVAFYEFIREKILKPKVCPHFITMYGYFISLNSRIDYDAISTMDQKFDGKNVVYDNLKTARELTNQEKGLVANIGTQTGGKRNYIPIDSEGSMLTIDTKADDNEITEQEILKLRQDGKIYEIHKPYVPNFSSAKLPPGTKYVSFDGKLYKVKPYIPTLSSSTELQPGANYISVDGKLEGNVQINVNNRPPQPPKFSIGLTEYGKMVEEEKLITTTDGYGRIIRINPDKYGGKSLIILTESPTYSLFSWATKMYETTGNIHMMINTGVHSEKIWRNILFQLAVALYVMQINNIFIENFSLSKNVFIKDLPQRGEQTEYWKYKIDGIDYYIPNLGFLVMIDSNYRDLDIINDVKFTQKDKNHKLNGKFFGKDYAFSDENNIKKTFDMFKAAFDSNVFGPEFKKYGGVPPPTEIIQLLDNIMSDIQAEKSNSIGFYILEHMRGYIHNRIGTYLNESESKNRKIEKGGNFRCGEIVAMETGNSKFKFVMYLKPTENNMCKIITKKEYNDKRYIMESIAFSSLFEYIQVEPISQQYKPDEEKLLEDGLLETYVITKNT